MNPNHQTTACTSCQAANLPGVKFCANCGAPLILAAARSEPQLATTSDPLSYARDALTRAHATFVGGDGLTTLDYQLPYSDKLLAGPVTLHFAGTVTRTADGAMPYTVTARMLPKSMAALFGMCAAGAVVLGFLPRSIVSNDTLVGSVAIALGLTAWVAFSAGAKRARRHVEQLINTSSTSAPVSAAASAMAPVVNTVAAGGDAFAQLERLAQLQATGLLTADEVATKKAALLKLI
jgi:zinc-ribbon domain